MEPWQERVLQEKKELDEKLLRLIEFIGSEKFLKLELYDRKLLIEQKGAMKKYSDVLHERILNFPKGA